MNIIMVKVDYLRSSSKVSGRESVTHRTNVRTPPGRHKRTRPQKSSLEPRGMEVKAGGKYFINNWILFRWFMPIYVYNFVVFP